MCDSSFLQIIDQNSVCNLVIKVPLYTVLAIIRCYDLVYELVGPGQHSYKLLLRYAVIEVCNSMAE